MRLKKKKIEKGKTVLSYLTKHPTVPLVALGSSMSTANYVTNKKRHEQDREYQKDQLKAMEDLTKTLTNATSSMDNVNKSLNKIQKKDMKLEKINREDEGILSQIFKRKKLFSIESGRYEGNKRQFRKSSIVGGAASGSLLGAGFSILNKSNNNKKILGASMAIGAGLGAFTNWMRNIADKSIFYSPRSRSISSYELLEELRDQYEDPIEDSLEKSSITTENTDIFGRPIKNTREITITKTKKSNPKGILYSIDSDPKKSVINLLFQGNVMVMYLNKPIKRELMIINKILDSYCKEYSNADYLSSNIGKDSYIVEINTVSYSEYSIIKSLIDSGLKVNIITGQRFGIKNFNEI